jgi:hypothetical protein
MSDYSFCTLRKWAGRQFVHWSGLEALRASSITLQRRGAAKTVFERLWVAGTLGGFFSAFYLGLPHDLKTMVVSPLWSADNLDRLVRYLFFFWLLVYFFTSTVRKELRQRKTNSCTEDPNPPTTKDLLFDVVQTVSALTAAAFLGFIHLTEYSLSEDSIIASAVALAAVAVICFGSLLIFGCDAGEGQYNSIRKSGLKMSLLGLAFVILIPDHIFVLVLTLEVQIGLWAVLATFIRATLWASSP